MLQGVLCECLLIKVINKILNKNNKRVLLNERALNLEKFNAFKVETLKENVKGQIYVEGVTTTWMEEVKGHLLHAPAMKEGHPLLL